MHRCRPPSSSAGSGQNRPLGVCTSISSPARTSRTSHRENSPSGISRTPTRGRAPAGALMEYWRRCSTPSTIRRRVSDWPGVNANSSARSSGTSKVTATASSVSSSTSATVSGWKAASPSDLLHVLERLEAVRAAVERLARGRAVLRGQLGARRAALRAGHRTGRRASGSAGSGRRTVGAGPGAESPCSRSACAAALGDPVARPGRARARPRRGRRTRRRSAGAPGRRAWWPSPGSRSTSG